MKKSVPVIYWNLIFRQAILDELSKYKQDNPKLQEAIDVYLKKEASVLKKCNHFLSSCFNYTSITDRSNKLKLLFKTECPLDPIARTIKNKSFDQIMYDSAKWVMSSGDKVDLLWSGGIDSTSALLALHEVSPKQLRVVHTPGSVVENPRLYHSIVKHLDTYVYTGNSLLNLGQDLCKDNVFSNALSGDSVFVHARNGMRGVYPPYGNDDMVRRTLPYYYRYLHHNKGFRLLLDCTQTKIDPKKYKPFFDSPSMTKYLKGLVPGEFSHSEQGPGKDIGYRKAKMLLRDYIYNKTNDKEYAYEHLKYNGTELDTPDLTMHYIKTGKFDSNLADLPTNKGVRGFKTLHNVHVRAITSDGDVINRDNISQYNLLDFVQPDIKELCV